MCHGGAIVRERRVLNELRARAAQRCSIMSEEEKEQEKTKMTTTIEQINRQQTRNLVKRQQTSNKSRYIY